MKIAGDVQVARLSRLCRALFVVALLLLAGRSVAQQWPKADPKAVGLDAAKLAAFDADLAGGQYGLVDSMLVIRCGKQAYERSYSHDYGKIYGDRAKSAGPLNHAPSGEYNYFSTEFHPYYEDQQIHTMQSVSKTVTSVTIGAAMLRKEFPVELDTPILKYFEAYKIANLEDRKRRITLQDLLTMRAGLEWHEDLAYDDPKNSADVMEAQHDWVQYVIDQPMVSEPGKQFVYSSGVTQLLSHIFKQVTGQTVDDYAKKSVFKPLGVDFYWKHTPTGLPDTEGGLYLAPRGLARIGALYLNNGDWNGQQIVSPQWVKLSVTPHVQVSEEDWKYGFQWWLGPYGKPERLAWAARGFGGQELLVFPEYDTIAVFTGWSILPSTEGKKYDELKRVLDAIDTQHSCGRAASK
jgi:CubicO group peptidase (beta-lactamase class C family)